MFHLLKVASICLIADSLSDHEFMPNAQWKFAFLSLGRPEYLEDSDIVSSRFQVTFSPFQIT